MASDTASILNNLIEISKDGEQGFRAAAEDTKSAELKQVFLSGAQDCAKAVAELQPLVARFGEEPETSGSVAGAVHRGWMNLKSAVVARDEVAILEECERGEDVAKASYRKALESGDLPADVRAIVQRQYDGVISNHDKVRDLRDRYKAMSH